MYNIKCYNKLKVDIIFKFILALAIFMKNNYFQNFLELNLIQKFFGVCQKFKKIIKIMFLYYYKSLKCGNSF